MRKPTSKSSDPAFRVLGVSLAALSLTACETIDFGPKPHPLTGKTWRLTDVETEGGSTRLQRAQQERHTLRFNADGTLLLKLDCNQGNATWNASDPVTYNGTMSISQIAATRALCPPPTWGEDLALDLPSSTAYTLTPDGKGLVIRARRVTYAFSDN